MTNPPFPARGYAGPPDWNDLLRDFGPSMFFDGISITDAKARLGGRLSFLAIPFFDLTCRQRWASHAAVTKWRKSLSPEVPCLSPICLSAIGAFDRLCPSAQPDTWRAICLQAFRVTGPVIIPPVCGWEKSQELYQIAGTALSALRPVFVLKSEDL